MSYAARGALRSVKNVAKGYTDIQVKVREATSNDPGPINSDLMRQIASATHYDQQFVEIMIIMEKRLNDDGKNWRHVYKALVLLEYLLLAGSDRILQYARDNFYVVKTLKEFQYRDEVGTDHGHNVRQKAIKVSELLTNSESLARERNARRNIDDRTFGSGNRLDYSTGRDSPYDQSGSPIQSSRGDDRDLTAREEEDVRRAIQESLKTANRSSPITASRSVASRSVTNDITGGLSEEEQLQRAIELSKRDEEERHKRRGGGNGGGNINVSSASLLPSSDNNKSTKGQPLIDLLGGEDHAIVAPVHTGMVPSGGIGGNTITIQPTGATDPFALPQGNPFSMLATQPTGYSVPSFPTGYQPPRPSGGSMGDPFAAVNIMPTGGMSGGTNPFAMTAAFPTGTTIPTQSTGSPWGGSPTGATGAVGISMTGPGLNPFSSISSVPNRSSSTPPMVDLDNLGPPNRNPFAMTHHTGSTTGATSGGNFNWSNSPEPPKLTLAELAQQQQQHRITGMATGLSGVHVSSPAPPSFGIQSTGVVQPFGIHQTGNAITPYSTQSQTGHFTTQATGGIPPGQPFVAQPTGHTTTPPGNIPYGGNVNPFF